MFFVFQKKLSSYVDSLADEILSGKFGFFPDQPTLPELIQATKGKDLSYTVMSAENAWVFNFKFQLTRSQKKNPNIIS